MKFWLQWAYEWYTRENMENSDGADLDNLYRKAILVTEKKLLTWMRFHRLRNNPNLSYERVPLSKTQIMRRSKAPNVIRLDPDRLDSIAKEFHKVQGVIGKRRLVGAISFDAADTGVATVQRLNGRVKGTVDCGSGLNKQIADFEDVNILEERLDL
ncbi:hypothetical protein DFS34DRAFT_139519 [Phlyctochytrium arcticum]|nr:hypothetical protein DFS34DRAFT_139519 [Phlyctochytrium arcticum]